MHGDANNIIHLQAYVDNASGTATAIHQSRYTAYQVSNYDNFYTCKTTLSVGNTTENTGAGEIGTWNSARTIKWMVREYNSSYEYVVNRQYHWEGVGNYINNAQPILTLISTK